jgi:hypothetical protein
MILTLVTTQHEFSTLPKHANAANPRATVAKFKPLSSFGDVNARW